MFRQKKFWTRGKRKRKDKFRSYFSFDQPSEQVWNALAENPLANVRPHPGPLPRGEGERYHGAGNFSIFIAVTDSVAFTNQTHDNPAYHITQSAANDSPSPGGEGRLSSIAAGRRMEGEGGCHSCIHDFATVTDRRYKPAPRSAGSSLRNHPSGWNHVGGNSVGAVSNRSIQTGNCDLHH